MSFRVESSAVTSVLYNTHAGDTTRETKSGSYIYYGDAASYHEWEFGTLLRTKGKKGDAYVDAVSKIVDGLRSDAFVVSREVGLDVLWNVGSETEKSGIELLVQAMKAAVFPLTTHEAKELFRQYCKPSGSLSRQTGESMSQYVSRRKRCWKLLKELDPAIELSEGHRADTLLDLAGIDQNARVMVQPSIGNVREF